VTLIHDLEKQIHNSCKGKGNAVPLL